MSWHTATFEALGVTNVVTSLDPPRRSRRRSRPRPVRGARDSISRAAASATTPTSRASTARQAGGRRRPAPARGRRGRASDRRCDRAVSSTRPSAGARGAGLRQRLPRSRLADGRKPRVRIVPATGWERVRVDRGARHVRVPVPASSSTSGPSRKRSRPTARGRIRRDAAPASVLVGLGGDFAVAGAPPGGWPVRMVTEDHRDARPAPGPTVGIAEGGLATSTTTVRRWRAGDSELPSHRRPRNWPPADAPGAPSPSRASMCRRERRGNGRDRPRAGAPTGFASGSGSRPASCACDGAVTMTCDAGRWSADDRRLVPDARERHRVAAPADARRRARRCDVEPFPPARPAAVRDDELHRNASLLAVIVPRRSRRDGGHRPAGVGQLARGGRSVRVRTCRRSGSASARSHSTSSRRSIVTSLLRKRFPYRALARSPLGRLRRMAARARARGRRGHRRRHRPGSGRCTASASGRRRRHDAAPPPSRPRLAAERPQQSSQERRPASSADSSGTGGTVRT